MELDPHPSSLHPNIFISISPFTTTISHINHINIHFKSSPVQIRPTLSNFSLALSPHYYLSSLVRLCPTKTHQPMYFVHTSLVSHSLTPARHPQTLSNQISSSLSIPSTTSKELSHPRYAMQHQIQRSKSKSNRKETREGCSRYQALKWNLSASSLPSPSLGATYRLR